LIAEFMRRKGITRCPTACAVPTHAVASQADRAAPRDHSAARVERAKTFQLFAA